MRISDWSSDVCSSDLRDFTEEKVLYNTNNFYENCGVSASNIVANVETIQNPLRETMEMFERQLEQDRKSVVSGKSVSVRVDLGGRRVIKKKNNVTYITLLKTNKQTKKRNKDKD